MEPLSDIQLGQHTSIDATAVVRSFSIEVESKLKLDSEPDDLSQLMIAQRKAEDLKQQDLTHWRKYFEPWQISNNPATRCLDIEGNELSKAWEKLRNTLPLEERVQFEKRAQTIADVIDVVENVEREWRQKKRKGFYGQTKTYFRKICNTLSSHSTLLEILPSSSQYASVFCGTLQTLIKASANYEKIAEGLSKSIADINEAVDSSATACSLYPTAAIQQGVANLYAHIFLFMRDMIGWYTEKSSRRLLSSLKEDFYKRYEDQIENIKSISQAVNRKAQQGSQAELRVTRLQVEDLREEIRKDLRIGLENIERKVAETQYREQKMTEDIERDAVERKLLYQDGPKRLEDLLRRICAPTNSLLLEAASRSLTDDDFRQWPRDDKVKDIGFPTDSASDTSREQFNGGYQRRVDIQLYSRDLEDYVIRESYIMGDYDGASSLYIDWTVIVALQDWTTEVDSRPLCIIGPSQMSAPSFTSMIAAKYVASAAEARIPVVSVFCDLHHQESPDGSKPELQALISMTYGLIRQLIELLPATIEMKPDLGAKRFKELDGSMNTLAEALTIMKDLLNLSPSMLLCVIDGFDRLEDKSTERALKDFYKTLCGPMLADRETNGPPRVLKVLFTTAGRSNCLLSQLEDDQIVFAEQSSAGRRPGKPMPGRRSLSPLTLLSSFRDTERDLFFD